MSGLAADDGFLPTDEAAPAEPAAPPFDPATEELYQAARRGLLAPRRFEAGGLLLVATLVAFLLTSVDGSRTLGGIVSLVFVLLFHEAGHYLGMRAFGYRDVRMFFIPFFGAAVTGRREGVAAWKEALVLLLGPVPGIVAGAALLWSVGRWPLAASLALAETMLLLNAFNLLPLGALDGGKLLQRVLFSRHRLLETAFLAAGGLLLGLLAFVARSPLLGVFALLGLVIIPRRSRVLSAAAGLRRERPALDPVPERLGDADARALFLAACEAQRGATGVDAVATTMSEVLDATRRPPGALASLGLLLAWAAAGLVALAGGLFLATASGPARWEVVRAEPAWEARFPQPPFEVAESFETPAGPLPTRGRRATLGLLQRYTVEHATAPAPVDPTQADAWLAALRDGLAREVGAPVLREEALAADGAFARQVDLGHGWRQWRARIYVRGADVVVAVASAPELGPDEARFFESLRLAAPPAAP